MQLSVVTAAPAVVLAVTQLLMAVLQQAVKVPTVVTLTRTAELLVLAEAAAKMPLVVREQIPAAVAAERVLPRQFRDRQ
jgi:ABC-type Fe3+ transport system permease subunit